MSLVQQYEKDLQNIADGDKNSSQLIRNIREEIGKRSAKYLKLGGIKKFNAVKEVEELEKALREAIQNSYSIDA